MEKIKKTNPVSIFVRINTVFLSINVKKIFALRDKKIETRETRSSRQRDSGNVVNRSVAYFIVPNKKVTQ